MRVVLVMVPLTFWSWRRRQSSAHCLALVLFVLTSEGRCLCLVHYDTPNLCLILSMRSGAYESTRISYEWWQAPLHLVIRLSLRQNSRERYLHARRAPLAPSAISFPIYVRSIAEIKQHVDSPELFDQTATWQMVLESV